MKISHKKWNVEIISMSRSEAGGLKEVIASIRGNNIYSTLKYESESIEFKGFQIPKLKEEFILQQQQLYYLRQKK